MTTFNRVERRETITTTTLWRPGEPEKLNSRTVTVTRYTVSGAKPVSLYGDAKSRLYVPVSVTVEFTSDGRAPSVTVNGRLHRKDGSLGETTYVLHGLSGYRADNRPEWLTEIVGDAAR